MTTDEITNSQDLIDSRDIIARLAELDEARQASLDELQGYREQQTRATDVDDDNDDAGEHEEPDTFNADDNMGHITEYAITADWDEDTEREWRELTALQEEADGSPDWAYGETLIRDSYFEDYARQLAEDTGAIKGDEKWPTNCIDWEKAADELKADYTSVSFGDTEYWIRS